MNNQQYMATLEVKAKRAEQMKQYNQQNEMVPGCHWCGLEVTAKRAEQMKQYNRVLSVNICCSLRCLLAQKAKRTEQMKQYNQQYKDAAEQAETSKLPGAYWAELSKATIKLGPFGADPFGDGAASEDLPQPESQPDSEGKPFYSELYPHCGCDPAKGCFSPLGASWCRVASF